MNVKCNIFITILTGSHLLYCVLPHVSILLLIQLLLAVLQVLQLIQQPLQLGL